MRLSSRQDLERTLGGKFQRQVGSKIIKHFLLRVCGSTGASAEEDFKRISRVWAEKGKEQRQGCHGVLEQEGASQSSWVISCP